MLLLAASYIFYFLADPRYLIFIAITTISTFVFGFLMDRLKTKQTDFLDGQKATISKEDKKEYKARIKAQQRKWFIICILINFGILVFIKYSNFTIANVNFFLEKFGSDTRLTFLNIIMPMGISFYIFQSMSYLIDVYRGKFSAEKNIFRFALFVSFFPQLVQGPISRFDDLSQTLFAQHSFDKRNVSFGLQRILWGLFKKLVIADRILVAVNTIIKSPDDYSGVFVFIGMMFYAIQLYADFTGGIDITIGIAEVLGIKVKENFNAPFMARSITEYWRRWHITMGTWFRDYLFYPISVSKPMLNLARASRRRFGEGVGKRIPVYISTLVVWLATGAWHGSEWNFIVWGLMNGVVIIISQEFEPLYARFHGRFDVKENTAYKAFTVVRTVLLMSSLRMFDCYMDVPLTFKMFGSMFTNWNLPKLFDKNLMGFGLTGADYLVLAVGIGIMIISGIKRDDGDIREHLAMKPAAFRYAIFYILIIAVIVLGAYGVGYDSSQFIYNRF